MTDIKKVNILIIDDDDEFLDLLKEYLRKHGYSVFISRDGEEGLSMVERYSIDIVISDLIMPNLNGAQLLECLKENDFKGEVIMMSGIVGMRDLIREFEDYICDYLKKPFFCERIIESISKAANRMINKDLISPDR